MSSCLQSCSIGKARGLAAYRPGDRASRTMTAEGLVCRYFLSAENSPAALGEGAAYVLEERPQQQNFGESNKSYNMNKMWGVTDGARTHNRWSHNPELCLLSYGHHACLYRQYSGHLQNCQ